ncbi:hypothetical protein D3C85_1137540 [compost metagenome]
MVERKREALLDIGEPVLAVEFFQAGLEEFPGEKHPQRQGGKPVAGTVEVQVQAFDGRRNGGVHGRSSLSGQGGGATAYPRELSALIGLANRQAYFINGVYLRCVVVAGF